MLLSPHCHRSFGGGFLAVLLLAAHLAGAALQPVELRCEYLVNPLGLDIAKPRLSWRLESGEAGRRAAFQTAYELTVVWDGKTIWSSGRRETGQTQFLEWTGPALRRGEVYWWRVRVWDDREEVSNWSDWAWWSMGPTENDDWSAHWIGDGIEYVPVNSGWPLPDNTLPDPWLRRDFPLAELPTQALMHVASIGFHELYVNGVKVGDGVLQPGVSDLTQRARYVTYDLKPLLQTGVNTLAFWLGRSWSMYPYNEGDALGGNLAERPVSIPRTPCVLAEAEVRFADGSSEVWGTDRTWKTGPSPNTTTGQWKFMHFGGEKYDARLEVPGWNLPGLDTSGWREAIEYEPGIVVSAELLEPNRLIEEVRPVQVTASGPNWLYDMGRNYAGWFEMEVAGSPGQVIAFDFSELPGTRMTHNHRSTYIIGASGEGVFRHHFNYTTGRWVTVAGLDYEPALADVRGWLVRTGYERASTFSCANDLLNRIYATTMWTFESLSLGGYVVDCPQRERMGYGGDAHSTTRAGLNNFRLGAFYTKWSGDWRDLQYPNGDVEYTAPTYWGGGGPSWSGFCVTLPWELYLAYGDQRILTANWPTIVHWLTFLETKSSGDILRRWGGNWDFLGDWLWPGASGTNGDTRESLFFNNCYWLHNLQTAATIAQIIGKYTEASVYRERVAAVRAAVHAEFYDPAAATYVNGQQAYLSAALLTHLPPDEEWPRVWASFEANIAKKKGRIDTGITGTYFLLLTLMDNQRHDLIYGMTNTISYPSWGYMLDKGGTTLWESWSNNTQSKLHSSYVYIGAWFPELAGIAADPQQPGWRHFFLRPAVVPSLGSAEGTFISPYGQISCAWRIEGGEIVCDVTIPPNTTATLLLPTSQPSAATESGRAAVAAPGVSQIYDDGPRLRATLGSGRYSWRAPYIPTLLPKVRHYRLAMEQRYGTLAPPGLTSGWADADGDGLANALEFAVGRDPFTAETSLPALWPLTIEEGPGPTVRVHSARYADRLGVRWRLQTLDSPSHLWRTLPALPEITPCLEPGTEILTFTEQTPPNARFYRLLVEEE